MISIFSLLVGCRDINLNKLKGKDPKSGVYENEFFHSILGSQYDYEVLVDGSGMYRGVIPKSRASEYVMYDDDNDYEDAIWQHFLAAYIAEKCVSKGFSICWIEKALSHVGHLPKVDTIEDEEMRDVLTQCYNILIGKPIYAVEHKINEKEFGCGEYRKSLVLGNLDVYVYDYNIKLQRITNELIEKQSMIDYEIKKEFPSLNSEHVGAMIVSFYSGL